MSTKTTTIRFNEEEQRLLDLFMEFQDRPLSTVLKDALFEEIMDFFDSIYSEEAINFNESNDRKYTTTELMEVLGLNE